MTRGEFVLRVEFWQHYLRRLGFEHWNLKYVFEDDIDGTEAIKAKIDTYSTYENATIYVREDQLELPQDEIDQLIVHELLHISFRDINATWDDLLDNSDGFGQQAKNAWDRRFDVALEILVDKLAREFVVHLS